jgi:ABC-2 type transport system ATP-binding protein
MASHDKPTSDADREQDAPASEAAPSSEAAPPSMAPLSQEEPVVKTGGKKRKKHAETAVRLKNVSRRFGAHTAVNNVSLRIRGGSVYGLIGPNGAGKTTTFSMMAGYLTPSEGQVEILGFSPTDVPSLRGRLGVLPQDAMLPGADKVGEFLVHMGRLQGLNPEQAEQEAREGLKEVDGADWWNLRCGNLSHGMAKRVGIAQAFLGDPEVVLLDEPTAGLDPRIAYEVRQIVRARKGRATLIVSSHNLQELEEICDAAAILDRGRLVANGTINELTASSEEIHIKIAPGPLPLEKVSELPAVKRAEFIEESRDLVVYFERSQYAAEAVIGMVLWVLLQERVMISGVTKGRGLERRVMDLTEG